MEIEPNVAWSALFSPLIIKLFLILVSLASFLRIAGVLIGRQIGNDKTGNMKSSTLAAIAGILLVVAFVSFKML